MQFYWQCSECKKVNRYPSVHNCETCGATISSDEEQRVLNDIRMEEKYQKALDDMEVAKSIEQFERLADIFASILLYKDAELKWVECLVKIKELRKAENG